MELADNGRAFDEWRLEKLIAAAKDKRLSDDAWRLYHLLLSRSTPTESAVVIEYKSQPENANRYLLYSPEGKVVAASEVPFDQLTREDARSLSFVQRCLDEDPAPSE